MEFSLSSNYFDTVDIDLFICFGEMAYGNLNTEKWIIIILIFKVQINMAVFTKRAG